TKHQFKVLIGRPEKPARFYGDPVAQSRRRQANFDHGRGLHFTDYAADVRYSKVEYQAIGSRGF
ncbi:hypothetical protein UFOVP1003_1, partial [uncultured Caudovirales phage]